MISQIPGMGVREVGCQDDSDFRHWSQKRWLPVENRISQLSGRGVRKVGCQDHSDFRNWSETRWILGLGVRKGGCQ